MAGNPCADQEYLELRRIPTVRLDERQKRTLEELDNACIDFRLALARERDRSGRVFPREGAEYKHEVLPWVVGTGVFSAAVYLFTSAM